MLKLKIKKWLRFPTPIELGKSNSNSLPSKCFNPKTTSYAWEDYDKDLQQMFPKKFWLYKKYESLEFFVKYTVLKPFTKAYWWAKYHTTQRYHILDLRQPDDGSDDSYRYGYRDIDNLMVYAMFNLLDKYIEHAHIMSDEEYQRILKETGFDAKSQYDHGQEAVYLHNWWHVERKQNLKKFEQLQDAWFKLRKTEQGSEKEQSLLNQVSKMEVDLENDLNDKLIRLVKIRSGLWT